MYEHYFTYSAFDSKLSFYMQFVGDAIMRVFGTPQQICSTSGKVESLLECTSRGAIFDSEIQGKRNFAAACLVLCAPASADLLHVVAHLRVNTMSVWEKLCGATFVEQLGDNDLFVLAGWVAHCNDGGVVAGLLKLVAKGRRQGTSKLAKRCKRSV